MINPGSLLGPHQPQSSPPASHVFSLVQQQKVHGTQHKRLLLPGRVTKTDTGNGRERGWQGRLFTTGWVEGSPAGRVSAWHPEVSERKYRRSSGNLLTEGHRLKRHGRKMSDQAEDPVGLACAGLKFRVTFRHPTGSKHLLIWTLQDNPTAYFPELINALALAPKPGRTPCLPTKFAGI